MHPDTYRRLWQMIIIGAVLVVVGGIIVHPKLLLMFSTPGGLLMTVTGICAGYFVASGAGLMAQDLLPGDAEPWLANYLGLPFFLVINVILIVALSSALENTFGSAVAPSGSIGFSTVVFSTNLLWAAFLNPPEFTSGTAPRFRPGPRACPKGFRKYSPKGFKK